MLAYILCRLSCSCQSYCTSQTVTGSLFHPAGVSGSAAVPMLHLPSHDDSPLVSHRLAVSSSRQSSSAHALTSPAAPAAAPSPSASASALRASRGSLVTQSLTQAVLTELALQQPDPLPAARKHASPSSTAFGRGLDLQKVFGEGGKQRGKAPNSAACESRPGGKRKKKSRHAVDPAMEHVEVHLQILKRVHIKHASPRCHLYISHTQIH